MQEVPMRKLNQHTRQVLEEMPVVVTYWGKPYALILPYSEEAKEKVERLVRVGGRIELKPKSL